MKLPDVAKRAAAPLFGYLVTTFQADKPGVFQHLSIGDDPFNFRPLNNGQAIFQSTVGSLQIRDPYLVASPNRDDFWILGTDLDVSKTSWKEAKSHGNHSIVVSHSKDMIHWDETYLLPVEIKDAGYVWGPCARWKDNSYTIVWASNMYDSKDTEHKKKAKRSVFRYTTTKDFKTVTTPDVHTVMHHRSILDPEILPLSNGEEIVFGTDVTGDSILKRYTWGSVLKKSGKYEGGGYGFQRAFLEFGGLGTASFQDNADPKKLHIWTDHWKPKHPNRGYEAYQARYNGKKTKKIHSHHVRTKISPAGLRHGSVTPLTKDEYERLNNPTTVKPVTEKPHTEVKGTGSSDVKDKPKSTGTDKPKNNGNVMPNTTTTGKPKNDGKVKPNTTTTVKPKSDGKPKQNNTDTGKPKNNGYPRPKNTNTGNPTDDGKGKPKGGGKV